VNPAHSHRAPRVDMPPARRGRPGNREARSELGLGRGPLFCTISSGTAGGHWVQDGQALEPGRPISTEYVRQLVHRLARRAGIPTRVTPHTLRHTFATRLLRVTGKVELTRKALRHANIQTTIETALTRLGKLRPGSNVPAWMLRICRNKIGDWRRQEARRSPQQPDPEAPDVAEVVEARERARAVAAACDRLRSPLREVFWLRKAQGLSTKEVADLTGLAVSSVHAYASQSCTKVRRHLAKSYPGLRETGVERNE